MEPNDKIINHIILYSGVERRLGLLDGKMGIALFLARYARSSGVGVCDEIAGDIVDEIWDNFSTDLPVGFAGGLCGIGWGVEYLIQHGFMEGDADEVCSEIDKAVSLQKIHSEMDTSLETGLEGILHYVMARMAGNRCNNAPSPFDADFLAELYGVTETLVQKRNGRKAGNVISSFNDLYTRGICEYKPCLEDFVDRRIKIDKRELYNNSCNIRNGLSGYIMRQMV